MRSYKCRACGAELNYNEFGVDRICPHCQKPSATVDIKAVHVKFGDDRDYFDPFGLDFENEDRVFLGIDYLKIRFNLQLTVGNISNPPYSNAFYYSHHFSCAKNVAESTESSMAKLAAIANDMPIYLWVDGQITNSYINFIYFVHLFKRFDRVYLVLGEDRTCDGFTYSQVSFDHKRILDEQSIDAYSKEYAGINKSAGMYRFGGPGGICEYDEEYLAQIVKSCAKAPSER
jgi:hypothetical protein